MLMETIEDRLSKPPVDHTNWVRPVGTLAATAFVLALATPAFAAVDAYTIGVNGMACPFCAYGIEKKLKATDGVESIDIRIKQGEVDVRVERESVVTPSDLDRAIVDAGFEIRNLRISGTATLEKTDGTVEASFTEKFSIRVEDFEGELERFELRADVTEHGRDGGWVLRNLERVK